MKMKKKTKKNHQNSNVEGFFFLKKKKQVKHTSLSGLVYQGLKKATTIKFSFSNRTR
jgi:predicted small secreted protein